MILIKLYNKQFQRVFSDNYGTVIGSVYLLSLIIHREPQNSFGLNNAICLYCQSSSIVKNGNAPAPSEKLRWKDTQRLKCKKCNRTFSKDLGKGYPPTSASFEFIAFMLYRYDRKGFSRYVNAFLKWLGRGSVDENYSLFLGQEIQGYLQGFSKSRRG